MTFENAHVLGTTETVMIHSCNLILSILNFWFLYLITSFPIFIVLQVAYLQFLTTSCTLSSMRSFFANLWRISIYSSSYIHFSLFKNSILQATVIRLIALIKISLFSLFPNTLFLVLETFNVCFSITNGKMNTRASLYTFLTPFLLLSNVLLFLYP